MLRKLYDWVLAWADSPYGAIALFIIAFAESSFFPIPPDVLLIALSVGAPKKSFRFALVCSAGSVIGGCFGYLIGWQFMESIGSKIAAWYHLDQYMTFIEAKYQAYDAWAIGIAGFTPIPYKVFTITAGMFHIHFGIFVLMSILSRSARFFIVSGIIYLFGPMAQRFIDRYFNLLATAFVVLLVLSFLLVKVVLHSP